MTNSHCKMVNADLVNILARILDSERNFNGSADLMITADRRLDYQPLFGK